jgi:chemotaxis protein CheD
MNDKNILSGYHTKKEFILIPQVFKSKNYKKEIFLYPGELHIARQPTLVTTVLGSCVSIIFFNPRRKIGGICHAQLPGEEYLNCSCTEKCPVRCYSATPKTNKFRYVTCSFRYMLHRFMTFGIPQDEIEVKLFGGSTTFKGGVNYKSVGQQNIEVSMQIINEHRLKITDKNVGGVSGRRIYFLSDTGEVYLKPIRSSLANFH